jgi:hypothetical protein
MLPIKKKQSAKKVGKVISFRRSKLSHKRKGLLSSFRKKKRRRRLRVAPLRQLVPIETVAVYDQGYNAGYDRGFDKGYRDGKHDGGDAIVDRLLPDYQILPEITIEQIVAAGVEHLRPHIYHLLTARDLGDQIIAALDAKTPFSLVRLGDGELLTLAQETILPIEQIKQDGPFLPYAGVEVPDLEIKAELVQAIRGANVVGIPKLRVRNFQPLAFAVFKAEHINYHKLTLTDSLVNYYIYHEGYLSRITQGRRVLLVGNLAPHLAEVLRAHGVNIVGEITPVHGVKDIPHIKENIAGYDFDIALVSAGISAVIISEWIASSMGKVAIDFGHLADSIVKGEAPYR